MDFWQWDRLGVYLETVAGFIVTMTIAHFALGWLPPFVEA